MVSPGAGYCGTKAEMLNCWQAAWRSPAACWPA